MPIAVNEEGILVEPGTNHQRIRSEAMSELISPRSGFLNRWALVFFLILALCLLTASWFIMYPEVIKMRAILKTNTPSKPVLISSGGKLTLKKLEIGQKIYNGSIIGFLNDGKKKQPIISPESGIIESVNTFAQNAAVSVGDTILSIRPGASEYYAQMELPQQYYSKIYEGQPTIMRLDVYPYKEYGALYAKLSRINPLIRGGSFVLRTTILKDSTEQGASRLLLQPGMTGEVHLIIRNQRFLQKLYQNLFPAFGH